MKKTLTISRAAEFLGVHKLTLREWARRGLLRCWGRPGGGWRRFDLADLEEAKARLCSAPGSGSNGGRLGAGEATHTDD